MTCHSTPFRSLALRLRYLLGTACLALAACGGGSADAPPPPETGPVTPPALVGPTITQQPVSVSVTAGQPASFTVAATGTTPLAYQWQRNGAAIAGATGTTYTLGTTALADSGAVFKAVVSNVVGNATSNDATLTVTTSAPVLTITPQPASVSVIAGATASFTVGGTCSSGTLTIQWQRLGASAFADIAGATSATYSFSTAMTDNGAQFRAALSCSGQAATASSTATLTVTAPGGATLSLYTLNGLRDQAQINGVRVIDQLADGSYAMSVNSQIKRLSADRLSITTIAGDGGTGTTDGPAATAQFRLVFGITHDAAGVLYIADSQNHTIRKIAVDGTVSTLAGTAGQSGFVDGTGTAAMFNFPWGITMGPDGALYVADQGNNVIRRVTTAGVVTTYAGTGAPGYLDGPAATAVFRGPQGVAAAANGDIIVSDSSNQRVRRILRAGATAGLVETVAGTGASTSPGADGIGVAAVIPGPGALVLNGNNAYVRDAGGLIRQIDLSTRIVTTFAGSRTLGYGYADGPLGVGQLADTGFGTGLTASSGGGLVAADGIGLRSIDSAGAVTTFATHNSYETVAGTGVLVQLPLQASAIAVDTAGRVVNYDIASLAVRRIDASGNVTLTAGLTGGQNQVDGIGSAAQFGSAGLSITAGPANVLYVGDHYDVRRIGSDGLVTTLAGIPTAFGAVDGQGSAARFNNPTGLAVAPNGDLFVADPGNNAIRRVDPAGNVTTYAGVLGQSGRVDGPIATARLQFPSKLTVTPDGTLWFSDGSPGSESLRKVSPDGSTVSSVSTISTTGIAALTSDTAGVLYYVSNADLVLPGGLYSYAPTTGVSTKLVTAGIDQTLHLGTGSAAGLPVVVTVAVLGPKRLVLSGALQLLLVTLP